MAKVTMTSAPNAAIVPVGQPVEAARTPFTGPDTSKKFGALGSIDDVRVEVDDAFSDMRQFHQMEPDEVMRICSGHSARMSELRVQIQRIEDVHRQWKPVRTREVEPTLEELKQQYLIASRLQSVRELDWRMSVGQP